MEKLNSSHLQYQFVNREGEEVGDTESGLRQIVL